MWSRQSRDSKHTAAAEGAHALLVPSRTASSGALKHFTVKSTRSVDYEPIIIPLCSA
jgi:hypothetical protein